MVLTLRGKFWHSKLTINGRVYRASTKLSSHREALAWEDAWRSRIVLGQVGLGTAPKMAEVWANWYKSAKSRVSAKHLQRAESAWRIHLDTLLGSIRADRVDESVVELVRSRYLEGHTKRAFGSKPRTHAGANCLLGYLRMLMRHAATMHKSVVVPRIRMPRPQAPVRAVVPHELVDRFLLAVDRTGNLHQSVAARLCLYLGLREGEALGARWEWFAPELDSYTPGITKGREAEPLPIPRIVRVWVYAICWGVPPALGWVLPAADGLPHRPGFLRAAIKRAGIPGISVHSLRRSCATQLSQSGTPIPVISRALRHKDIRTTMLYVQTGTADIAAAQERTWGVPELDGKSGA